MPASRRAQRRNRGKSHQQPQQFATFGEERDRVPSKEPSRDPRTLNDFDPQYGKTYSAQSQPRGGQAPYERESYGRGGGSENVDASAEHEAAAEAGHGGGESGFGKQYGQGFGVGAGRGVESGNGLEGQRLEERDYRGNAGMTFGAPVGPDALKEDTSQDRREDPKPEK
jgi:hypothetical protein